MSILSARFPGRRAFTLIELLVVIVIIAILASVALVAFRAVKIRSNRATAAATLRSLGQTIEVYVGDNNNFYPGAEGGTPALASLQNAMVKDPTQLSFYLAEQVWGDSLTDAQKAKENVLIEFVPKIAVPYVRKSGGETRELYYLYHVNTDETNPEPGKSSIDPTKSVWGQKAGRIAYDKSQVPMISDVYLSGAWDDYKEKDKQTFWGDTFNVLYFDGHGETVRGKDFKWIEVMPGGGKK